VVAQTLFEVVTIDTVGFNPTEKVTPVVFEQAEALPKTKLYVPDCVIETLCVVRPEIPVPVHE
jgi:hypothetical protein